MLLRVKSCFIIYAACFAALVAQAQSRVAELEPNTDARGETDLTVCSQNLNNYGSYEDSRSKNGKLTSDDFVDKERALVRRFIAAGCDVIAVQELLGKNEEASEAALQRLSNTLRTATNRVFVPRVGPSSEGKLSLGFLVATDRAEASNLVSYDRVELPRLAAKQKPRLFSRGPLELQITARSRENKVPKSITFINMHLKSQRGGADDPAALEWETFRMEMAEALRRIVERRHAQSFGSGETLLLILGDRNSNFDVASAKILEGTLTLRSFQDEAPCRLSKRGVPLCKAETAMPQRLFSVLIGDPRVRQLPGTFRFNDEFSWLDDIVMPAESLRYAWETPDSEGKYSSGVIYTPKLASDHALIYVKLNW